MGVEQIPRSRGQPRAAMSLIFPRTTAPPMKKLSLHLDDLSVQSFSTAHVPASHGTVHGRAKTLDCPTTSPFVCPDTEYESCGIVCLPTYQTGACVCG